MTQYSEPLQALPASRVALLEALKARGQASLRELAEALGHTREAVRQQVVELARAGWVVRERSGPRGRGRPAYRYSLSEAGDHLFPKHYDRMSLELLDALAESPRREALHDTLAALTERQVRRWLPELEGLDLAQRLEKLKGVYYEGDPWTETVRDERGWTLVERNCPFLAVASRRPQLCSVTVSTLSRLLGRRVRREARFQDGDRRCVFRVLADRPVGDDFRFELEPEYAEVPPDAGKDH